MPHFRTQSVIYSDVGNCTITIPKPSGLQNGDLMLVFATAVAEVTDANYTTAIPSSNTMAGIWVATPPSGLTAFSFTDQSAGATGSRIACKAWRRVIDGTEPSSYAFVMSKNPSVGGTLSSSIRTRVTLVFLAGSRTPLDQPQEVLALSFFNSDSSTGSITGQTSALLCQRGAIYLGFETVLTPYAAWPSGSSLPTPTVSSTTPSAYAINLGTYGNTLDGSSGSGVTSASQLFFVTNVGEQNLDVGDLSWAGAFPHAGAGGESAGIAMAFLTLSPKAADMYSAWDTLDPALFWSQSVTVPADGTLVLNASTGRLDTFLSKHFAWDFQNSELIWQLPVSVSQLSIRLTSMYAPPFLELEFKSDGHLWWRGQHIPEGASGGGLFDTDLGAIVWSGVTAVRIADNGTTTTLALGTWPAGPWDVRQSLATPAGWDAVQFYVHTLGGGSDVVLGQLNVEPTGLHVRSQGAWLQRTGSGTISVPTPSPRQTGDYLLALVAANNDNAVAPGTGDLPANVTATIPGFSVPVDASTVDGDWGPRGSTTRRIAVMGLGRTVTGSETSSYTLTVACDSTVRTRVMLVCIGGPRNDEPGTANQMVSSWGTFLGWGMPNRFGQAGSIAVGIVAAVAATGTLPDMQDPDFMDIFAFPALPSPFIFGSLGQTRATSGGGYDSEAQVFVVRNTGDVSTEDTGRLAWFGATAWPSSDWDTWGVSFDIGPLAPKANTFVQDWTDTSVDPDVWRPDSDVILAGDGTLVLPGSFNGYLDTFGSNLYWGWDLSGSELIVELPAETLGDAWILAVYGVYHDPWFEVEFKDDGHLWWDGELDHAASVYFDTDLGVINWASVGAVRIADDGATCTISLGPGPTGPWTDVRASFSSSDALFLRNAEIDIYSNGTPDVTLGQLGLATGPTTYNLTVTSSQTQSVSLSRGLIRGVVVTASQAQAVQLTKRPQIRRTVSQAQATTIRRRNNLTRRIQQSQALYLGATSSVVQVRVSAHAVTLIFDTALPAICTVNYGPTPAFGSSVIETGGPATHHVITLVGLPSGSTIYYEIEITSTVPVVHILSNDGRQVISQTGRTVVR